MTESLFQQLTEKEIRELRGILEFEDDDMKKEKHFKQDGVYRDYNGRCRIDIPAFCEWFCNNVHFFFVKTTGNNSLKYLYDKSGVYREVCDDVFKGAIKNALPAELRKTSYIRDIFEQCKMNEDMYKESDDVNSDENIINFKNGILHLDTRMMTPHSPEHISTIQIPVDYNVNASPSEKMYFINFLIDLTGGNGDAIELLFEFIGLAISNIKGYRTKKALFLVGKGNTGKSQFRKLLSALVGEENDTSIDLEAMEGRFGTSQLMGKRLAGSNDMKFTTVGQLGIFKQLTGGDRIFAEKKGKDGFSMIYGGLLCFCANELPRFGGDKGEHVYERFMVVECNNVIPPEKRDPKLLEKMLEEKEYIVSIAIDTLYTLIDNGFLFKLPQSSKDFIEKYRIDNDSVLTFIQQCTERMPLDLIGYGLRTSDVYRIYCRWCNANGEKYVSNRVFYTRLCNRGIGERKKLHGYDFYSDFKICDNIVKEYSEQVV